MSPQHGRAPHPVQIVLAHSSAPCVGMEGRTLEELQAERRSLCGALAGVRQQMRVERQRATDAEKRQASAWKLSPTLERTVLIIYALAGYAAEPAVKFLAGSGRRRHWPDKSDEELEDIVVDCFLHADAAEVASLIDTDAPADAAAMEVATRYVEQWRLVVWTRDANVKKGVAPSTDAVLQRLGESRLQLPDTVRPTPRGIVAEASARQWARRWRRRWGGRHAKLRVRGDVGLPDMRHKAYNPDQYGNLFLATATKNAVPKGVPYSGTAFGPAWPPAAPRKRTFYYSNSSFWALEVARARASNRYRYMAPVLVPRFCCSCSKL